MKVTFLGTGTSCGVPMPTCSCAVCTSSDPHDKRLRASIFIETDEGRTILVDCGPDLRTQVLRAGVMHIDALLLTHNHFDHIAGIDDLRAYAYGRPLTTFADQIVSRTLLSKWDYVFGANPYPGTAQFDLHVVGQDTADEVRYVHGVWSRVASLFTPQMDERIAAFPHVRLDKPFIAAGVQVLPIRMLHGALPVLGFRIGRLAYLTDVTFIPEDELGKLDDIETLIVDALRPKPHPTHWSVAQALLVVERLRPQRTYFTHMSHEIGLHAEVCLPAGVLLAYDGLQIDV